jgi:hypothetical protein
MRELVSECSILFVVAEQPILQLAWLDWNRWEWILILSQSP